MKKLLTFLTLLTLSIGVTWAAEVTDTWTASSGAIAESTSGTISTTGGKTWNFTRNTVVYTGWTDNCIQLGSKSGAETVTFSSSAYGTSTIKSVSVECASYQGAHKVSISVGGNTYLASTATSSWTTVETKTGTGTSSGQIVISFTNGSRALYIKSISVTYEDGGGDTPQPTTYFLTLPTGLTGGTVTSNYSGDLTQIASGTNITVTATPATGYTLDYMKANGVNVENPFTFAIDEDTEITAAFKEESTTPSGDYLFYESWSNTIGTGGNDGLWSGSIASGNVVSDQTGWTYENQSGGDNCLKLGTSSKKGTATTPSIAVENRAVYTLTFKAGAWNGGSEYTNLILSATGATLYSDAACTIALSSVKMTKGAWSDYTVYVKATNTSLKIKWSGQNSTNSRFFLDEVKIVAPASAAHTISVTQPEEGGTISTNVATADAGDVITVTATPATGYELTALAYNGTPIDITSTPYTFTMPDADVTLTATFSLKNYVVAYEVTPSTAAANSGNRVGLISGAPYDDQTQASYSKMGTLVTFKLYTGNGWQIDDANVRIAYTDANGNPATLTPTKGDTNSDDGGYGTYFTFTMPSSDVMINAAYLPYQPDLYILGNVNGGTHWNDGGLKMTFDPSANTYSIRIYASEENGYFRFYANGGNNGNPSYGAGGVNLNPLEGTQPKDLWKDGDANFCVPAGIYDIVVGQIYDDPTTNSNPNWWGQTTVTVTRVEPTFTFNPADGSTVYQGTNVTVTSNLYDLLHAINSEITESSVTNEVSLDGTTFSSSVALSTSATSVTGRATYGYIQPTATASYTVNEIPAGSEYTLVTDASELNNGDEIVFMSKGSGSGYAMSTTQASNNRPQTEEALSIIDSKIVPSAETQIITLEGATGAWYFNVGDGYLYAASNSSNHLKTEATADDNAKATIAIGSGGVATIKFQGSNSHNWLRHNSSSKIFSCYESGQGDVYIFRKATGMPKVATPTFNPAQGTYTEAQSVTISCATDGATILYSTDGTNYSNYTGAITISETTTIYAKATKSGMTDSDVAQATYTINTPIQPGDGEFALVTGPEQLIAGREYIIVVPDLTSGSATNPDHHGPHALSAENAGTTAAQANARKAVDDIEMGTNNLTAIPGNSVEIFVLEGSEGAWKLHGNNGYLYGTQGQNYLNIGPERADGWDVASISIESGDVAKIQFNNDSRWIQCNPNKANGVITPYFSCYSSTQKQVYLYYREGNMVMPPVFTPNPGVYGIDVDVTISCPTSGATIYYTTDGSDPKTSSTRQEYTGEIIVSESTTFKAIAVKDGETSSVTEATYTISKSTDIETVELTYREPFTEGVGKFHVDNVSGFSPVWTLDGNYGIKGTSYSAGVNYAATSRFVSPIIDMTDATQPELTFSHQINSFFDDVTTQATLWIRETTDGTDGTWIQLPITFTVPAQDQWSNDIADIDLSDYAGKKVQISFLYTNPTAGSGAGTWEIQNFVVADNSEYRMVNNIAEFLALENGTKAKFRNPVTVLYDYAQYSSDSYHEYIWVKDESGFMQFYLIPTLNSDENSGKSAKAAYYENGDIIPGGFVVVKNYYENGKYVQAFSADALNAGFLPTTQKGLADPEYMDFDVLNELDATNDDDVATWSNRYITLEKIILTTSNKSFKFKNEAGTQNSCVGYNKYNGDGSLLKDGTTSADVLMPTDLTKFYNVKAILQPWQGDWEIMPIEFTEWKAEEVTLRKLCADGVENNEYKISNNLMCVFAKGNSIWVKDDTGQSISPANPANGDLNFDVYAEAAEGIPANTRLDQALYDQSNWCEIQLTSGNAGDFVGKIIKGGAIDGTFTNKTNPTMTGVTLTDDDIYSAGSYSPNYYMPANFEGPQACSNSSHSTDFSKNYFFMTPKPQEYAQIVWAVWSSQYQKFIMSTSDNDNGHRFEGEFSISFDLNTGASSYTQLTNGYGYNFKAIMRKTASKDGGYMVYPLDLDEGIDPATAIESVVAGNGEVKSVKFYNVAGIESATPFQGVNIVVTEYTDGSRTTTKMLRK